MGLSGPSVDGVHSLSIQLCMVVAPSVFRLVLVPKLGTRGETQPAKSLFQG